MTIKFLNVGQLFLRCLLNQNRSVHSSRGSFLPYLVPFPFGSARDLNFTQPPSVRSCHLPNQQRVISDASLEGSWNADSNADKTANKMDVLLKCSEVALEQDMAGSYLVRGKDQNPSALRHTIHEGILLQRSFVSILKIEKTTLNLAEGNTSSTSKYVSRYLFWEGYIVFRGKIHPVLSMQCI